MPGVRPIPPFVSAFSAKWELFRSVAYLDSGHVWTCGYGHTGVDVDEHTTCNQGTGLRWLNEDEQIAAYRLSKRLMPAAIAALGENQYGALCDFTFNTGAGPDWDIWADINKGKLDDVPFQLARFNKFRDPKTRQLVVSNGLNHRRQAEIAMWNTPDPMDLRKLANPPPLATAIMTQAAASGGPPAPSSALLRNVETPQTAAPRPGLLAGLSRIFA
jgi:lysozyme